MKPFVKVGLSALLLSTLLFGCDRQTDTPAAETATEAIRPSSLKQNAIIADTVYKNGKIYTVNNDQPWAEAVAIKDGKFLVVGSASDVAAVTTESTEDDERRP